MLPKDKGNISSIIFKISKLYSLISLNQKLDFYSKTPEWTFYNDIKLYPVWDSWLFSDYILIFDRKLDSPS